MDKVLSLDVGGSFIKYAIINSSYEILSQNKIDTPTVYNDFIYAVKDIVKSVKDEIDSISLALPGGYNFLKDEIFAPNLTSLNGKNIKRDLKEYVNLDVYVENDANLAALGEYTLYEKDKIQNMILITLGTGVGGGLIIDGKLPKNPITSFEVGHISLEPRGRLCGCGRLGCFDEYCSSVGLLETYKELIGKDVNLTPVELGQLADKGDKIAVTTFNKYAKQLAFGLLNIANLFYAEKIKIGGGLSELSRHYISECQKLFNKDIFPMYRDKISLEVASLKNNAGIIGAGINYFNNKK